MKNFILTKENFLSFDECEIIINHFKNKVEKETKSN